MRNTTRLLRLCCPVCGVELQIHVRGLPQTVDPEAWLEELPAEARDFIHEEHVLEACTVVEGPRA